MAEHEARLRRCLDKFEREANGTAGLATEVEPRAGYLQRVQRRALEHAVGDIEIAAIHRHTLLATTDEDARSAGRMSQQHAPADGERDGTVRLDRERHQFCVRPASTTKLLPVQPALSSLATNNAMRAT